MLRSHLRRMRTFWVRCFALLVLLCAAPGSADVAKELVEYATGSECCEDDTCGPGADGCSGSCVHCACCAHPTAFGAAPALLPAAPSVTERTLRPYGDRPYAPGYRAPPFRPPAS